MLLALSLSFAAETAPEEYRYVLAVDGRVAGHREVKVDYVSVDSGEVHVLESWTELSLTVAGQPFSYRQRASGPAGGGFSSVISENGVNRQVQGVKAPSGWVITVGRGKQAKVWDLPYSRVQSTTLTLLDPVGGPPPIGPIAVVATETGDVLTGEIALVGPVVVEVHGTSLNATEYAWTVAGSEVRLAFDEAGHLLRYTSTVQGIPVTAILEEVPSTRDFGSGEGGLGPGPAVDEKPL